MTMHKLLYRVDLVKLINEVTSDWVPKALEKDIDLGVNCQLQAA